MSPYPAQVSAEQIVNTARDMIERDGLEQLSLARLAAALGIKAPSLYRHVDSKNALLRLMLTVTSQELTTAIRAEPVNGDPRSALLSMAQAYRAFAHAHPIMYGLLYSNTQPDVRPDAALLEQFALPLQDRFAAYVGEAQSLAALRGAFALVHGFVMLELSQQFQRGGNLDDVFNRVFEAYLDGWQPDATPDQTSSG